MTTTGADRLRYSTTVEAAPSRFTDPTAYAEWAARADKWAALDLMPDLGAGTVHGIKSLAPCIVQCDGCGKTHTGDRIAFTVILSGIVFNPKTPDTDHRRMCEACWLDAGWRDDNLRGWMSA